MLKVKVKAENQTDLLVTRNYPNNGAFIVPDSLTTAKDNKALIQILNNSATKQTVSENSLLAHYDIMQPAVHSVSILNRMRDKLSPVSNIKTIDVNCAMES